jgi:hypothetical protein
MSEPNDSNNWDPFETWRGVRDAGMEAWAKNMVETVNSEAYSQASGAMLDAYLTASVPFREMLEKTMTRVLGEVSLPTRADFVSLAERLTNIEMRLDDMDAKLDRIERRAPAAKKPAKEA